MAGQLFQCQGDIRRLDGPGAVYRGGREVGGTTTPHDSQPGRSSPAIGDQQLGVRLVTEVGRSPRSARQANLGAGPYTLLPSKTVSGSVYTYLPNKFYYDQSKVRWSKIVVRVIPTATAMLQALRTGEIDVSDGDQYGRPRRGGRVQCAQLAVAVGGFVFADRNGLVSKPLADVRVRQALNYAVDRKTIVKGLWNDTTKPSSQFYASDSFDAKAKTLPLQPDEGEVASCSSSVFEGVSFEALTCSCFGVWAHPSSRRSRSISTLSGWTSRSSAATTAEWLSKSRTKQYPVNSTALGVRPMASDVGAVAESDGPAR